MTRLLDVLLIVLVTAFVGAVLLLLAVILLGLLWVVGLLWGAL